MVQFNFTYDPGISVEQRTGFELAARIWGAYLTDDITVNLHIASVDELEGNAIGGAVPVLYEQNYGVFTQYLENDATNSSVDQQALESLQDGNTVDVIVDGEVIDGNSQLLLTSAQAKALGMDEALALENGGTWDRDLVEPDGLDGYIVINQSYDWNYDFLREGKAPASTLDFLSLAMHEIGHQLGFVSGLDGLLNIEELHSGETQVDGFTVLDLFRHTVESSDVDNADGAVSDLTLGANAYFSVDGGTTDLGEFSDGQRLQAAHWKRMKDALGIMDPTLAYRERLSLTELDLQAFDALGYEVNYGVLDGLDISTLLNEAEIAVNSSLANSSSDSGLLTSTASGDGVHQGMSDEEWWQIFEEQLGSLGWSDWWQIIDLGFGGWWQKFGQSLINQGYGQWWQIFEQNISQGLSTWFQRLETTFFDLGFGRWWQKFDLGNISWWQELEPFFLTVDNAVEGSTPVDSATTDNSILETAVDIVLSGNVDNILAGDENHNQIYAGAGDDLIDGKAGDDELWGEAGRDTIYGHDGNDKIYGGEHNDLLMGEAGNDELHGGEGHDILSGGEGKDILHGNKGHDDLRGGDGDDILSGNDGHDRLEGDSGNDLLIGGKGHDELNGGSDDDIVFGDAYLSEDEALLEQLKQKIQEPESSGSTSATPSTNSESQQVISFENILVTHLESNVLENLTTQNSEGEESVDEASSTDSEPTVLGDAIRIEAESMALNGYHTEYTSVASNNRLIRTKSSGIASTSFTGDTGYYNIVVAYYDENDGLARLSASLAGVELDDWQLNQNLGSDRASTNNLVTRTIATQVQINTGDLLELQGQREYNEFARIDYVEFIPVSAPVVVEPTVATDGDTLQGGFGNDILFGGIGDDLIYGESQADNTSSLLQGAQTYNGHTYLLTEIGTWNEAQADAHILGGNLVTLNNSEEEAWLQQTFGTSESFWLGINDQRVEGQFEWVSGEAITYMNWAPGEPNDTGGGQDFGRLNYGSNNQWDDTQHNGFWDPDASKWVEGLRGIIEIDAANSDILVGGVGNDTLYGNAGNDTLYGDNLENVSASLTSGLVGHWGLDETTGIQANDTTGSHSGTLSHMTSSQWTTGQVGGALSFDGYNDRVIVADSSALDITNTLTLATWVKADTFEYLDGLIVKGTSNIPYALDLSNDGRLIFTANYRSSLLGSLLGSSGGEWSSNTALQANKWHHVAVTYDGSYLQFYVDGQLDSSHQASITFDSNDESFVLGADLAGGSHLDGALDDARVYNRALTADEVVELATLTTEKMIGGNDTLIGGVGNDTLVGGVGNDSLNGTDAIAVGYFEKDTLTGGLGIDTFILGDANHIYYQGKENQDYALITDFNSGEDLIVLHGTANDYTQSQQGNDTYLYASSDLVAVFENISNLNLSVGVVFA